jgi:hypothetical protein
MTRMTVSDLLTILYILADDWRQSEGIRFLKGKPSAKLEFSDREVITLLLSPGT